MPALMQSMVRESTSIPTFAEILRSDPDDFVEKYTDVAAISLACAVGLPKADGIDIPKCLRALDAMALWVERKTETSWHLFNRVPAEFQRSKNAFRVYLMLHHLHKQFGVRYNPERIDRANDDMTDSGDEFIHGILSERRTGTCASLPVFAVAVGRRLGYPLKLAQVPRHLIFRWHDESEEFNVEFKGDGAAIQSDEEYHKWPVVWDARLHQEYKQGFWLRSLSRQQEVALCLINRAYVLYAAEQDLDEALACVEAADRFYPGRYDIMQRAIQDKLQIARTMLTMICQPGGLERFCQTQETLVALGNPILVDQSRSKLTHGKGPALPSQPGRQPVMPSLAASRHLPLAADSKRRHPQPQSPVNPPFTIRVSGMPINLSFSTSSPKKREND